MSKVVVGESGARRLGTVAVVLSFAVPVFAQRERAQPPATLSWQTTLVPAGEPGDALIVSGTVFAADGKAPAPGVVVYAYQTDARGLYTPDGRPGVPRLHGWMRTDDRGRYEFRTIRPASYPGQTVAAHIHMSVDAGGREQTIDDIHFEGDPLLTASMRGRMVVDGPFSTLCRPERDASGARRCARNIRLGP
jgi:protocatechuate 3,4-dioxygenase beta subunit